MAHFTGLHAVQALPIVALLLAWVGVGAAQRVRLILIAAASYAGLFAILLTQALRGQSILAPDALTMTLFGVWALATAAVAAFSYRPRPARVAALA